MTEQNLMSTLRPIIEEKIEKLGREFHTVARINQSDLCRIRTHRGSSYTCGVHTVDPSGKPELELSEKYRQQADDVENAGYQRLASTLRELANSYASEARRIIDEHKQEEDETSDS